MRIKFPKSRRAQAIIAITIVALVVLSGAFAWNSFQQNRINTFDLSKHPGVNLHDDFEEGPDKDVYVENSGDFGVFVRVRLTEYLQTVAQGSLIYGHDLYEGSERSWHPHNGVGGVDFCLIDTPYGYGENWDAESFHDYYTWTMGGQKYYKTAVAQLGREGVFADNPEVCVDTEVYTATDVDQGIAQTLYADVITMAQWFAGGYIYFDGIKDIEVAVDEKAQGNFWIVDTDGWCYWAQTLKPKEATGLLLDSIDRTSKQFDSSVTYCIDVWLQAVDEADIGMLEVSENGGITDGGKFLVQLLSDTYERRFFHHLGNGVYIEVAEKEGTEPITQPVTYYFASEVLGESIEISGLDLRYTNSVHDEVNSLFTLQLKEGDRFDLIIGYDENNKPYVQGVSANPEGEYTFAELGSDAGGMTIRADDGSVIGTGSDGILGAPGGGLTLPAPQMEGDTFLIRTRLDMDWLTSRITKGVGLSATDVYKIADDVTVLDMGSANFTPIGTNYQFTGTFDGNGKTISNLNVDRGSKDYAGLFGYISTTGTVKALTLKDASVNGKAYVGTVAGNNAGKIESCSVTGVSSVTGSGSGIGGIAGHSTGPISDCDNAGAVKSTASGKYRVGGIAGFFVGTMTNCTNSGAVTNTGATGVGGTGGIVGGLDGAVTVTITGCTNNGVITGGNNTGGIVGYSVNTDTSGANSVLIEKSSNTNTVTGGSNIGGIVGYMENGKIIGDAVNKTVNTGAISGNGSVGGIAGFCFVDGDAIIYSENRGMITSIGEQYSGFGGIVGYNKKGVIDNCENTGEVYCENATGSIGGIAGKNGDNDLAASITNCTNNAPVKAQNPKDGHVGGIAGDNYGIVENCTNGANGTVTNNYLYTGGIVGRNINNKITNCQNLGSVSSGYDYIGGIVGYASNNGSEVQMCKNSGDISGRSSVGGIAGRNYISAAITQSFNTGAVTGTGSMIGGIVGENLTGCIIRNSYAWGNVKGPSQVGGVAGFNTGTVTNTYHAKGTITSTYASTGEARAAGLVGYNGGICTYNVALASELISVSGSNFGKTIGSNQTSTPNNYAYDMPLTGNGTWVSGTGWQYDDGKLDVQTPSYLWWSQIFKGDSSDFNKPAIWTWDEANSLPVLAALQTGTVTLDNGWETRPYRINSRTDLEWIASRRKSGSSFVGVYFKLADDIDMGNTNFEPIGTNTYMFDGKLDGGGYTIRNLKIDTTSVGLFGYISAQGSVKNLTLEDASLKGTSVGAIVALNLGTIEGCTVRNVTITATSMGSGSIAALNQTGGTITNCHITGTGQLNGNSNAGGIVGINYGTVSRCSNTLSVTGTTYIGGIVGRNYGDVSNCYMWGDVTASGDYAGGIAGDSAGNIRYGYHAKGTIKAANYAGGVLGRMSISLAVDTVSLADTVWATSPVGYAGAFQAVMESGGNTYGWNYWNDSMTITATNIYIASEGSKITAAHWESQAWWGQAHPGFDFTDIWIWDNSIKLPILRTVP